LVGRFVCLFVYLCLVGRVICFFVCWLVGWLVVYLVGSLGWVCWLVGLSVFYWLVGLLGLFGLDGWFSQLLGWLVGLFVGWLVD
jgi:hypothetical protein